MPQKLTLPEWLQLLEKRHPTEIDLGLERVGLVAERLAVGRIAPTVVSVAGTNGKGSCIAIMQHLLTSAGMRVGSYTSPHLIHYNERICIDGEPVEDALIVNAFEKIEAARGEISLTYFEFGTLAALLILQSQQVDVALLEVGLGGRLDAVNIVDADFAVVTTIAQDHQDWLGTDLAVIAYEKACIARAGRPLIYGDSECYSTVTALCEQRSAQLFRRGSQFYAEQQGTGLTVTCQRADGGSVSYDDLPLTPLPNESLLCALQVITLMQLPEIDSRQVARSISDTHIPGRCQQLDIDGVRVILDVAHNPAATQRLAEQLQTNAAASERGKLKAVVAAMADKDIAAMLAPLRSMVDGWYPAEISAMSRAISAQQWQTILYNVPVFNSVEQAFEAAMRSAESGDTLLVFGSFYTVGPVLAWLQGRGMSL